MELQIVILDSNLIHTDDKRLPKNDQIYTLQKNDFLYKADILQQFHHFLFRYNGMVANLF